MLEHVLELKHDKKCEYCTCVFLLHCNIGYFDSGTSRYPREDSLRIEDAGNYTCHVTNAIDTSGILSTTRLAIQCKQYF